MIIIQSKTLTYSIWPIDGILSGTIVAGQCGPGSNGYEEVLYISQTPRLKSHHHMQFNVITRTLKSLAIHLYYIYNWSIVTFFYSPFYMISSRSFLSFYQFLEVSRFSFCLFLYIFFINVYLSFFFLFVFLFFFFFHSLLFNSVAIYLQPINTCLGFCFLIYFLFIIDLLLFLLYNLKSSAFEKKKEKKEKKKDFAPSN